jgi:uncharacterized SAM-binding protein YcdF (DUF218 family)
VSTAIVVLGQQLHADHMPRRGLLRRVEAAIALWRQTPEAVLLMSGSRKTQSVADQPDPTEASVMREMAVCRGVPSWALWTEEEASNTAENAFYAVKRLEGLAGFSTLREVVVVTADWHLPRAQHCFQALVPLQWTLRFHPAPDDLTPERLRRDLSMMSYTVKDLLPLPHRHVLIASALRTSAPLSLGLSPSLRSFYNKQEETDCRQAQPPLIMYVLCWLLGSGCV